MLEFAIRPMKAVDAHAIATWRYPGEYSFYDSDADLDDLAELLDPAEWGQRYFAADELDGHTLAGFLMVKLSGPVAEIGLGLRPDLTGRGLGESFLRACLHFASAALGAQNYALRSLCSTAGRSPCTSGPVSRRLAGSNTSPTEGCTRSF